MSSIKLQIVSGLFGIAQLAPDDPLPSWFDGPGFSAMSRASDELTIICAQDRIPDTATVSANWRCIRSVGPFAFDQSGIVLSIIEPLSSRDIGVFVVCTFDGEHIMVSDDDWEASQAILTAAGHVFQD